MIKELKVSKLITGLWLFMYELGLKPAPSTAVISVGSRSKLSRGH